jgi:PD-(D/E)XK nuclease superfamily
VSDVIEVSYTGDLLAHRRCPRAWAYEKHVGMHPYEHVQAMEGYLVHHAMEWLTRYYQESGRKKHASRQELKDQLAAYFKILWGKGIRTTFSSRDDTIERVVNHLYPLPKGKPLPEVKAVVEGALHEEYPLRSVRKVVPAKFGGKSRVLLTGVLDVVVQQQSSLTYRRVWEWKKGKDLAGEATVAQEVAKQGDLEIWDYKGVRSTTGYLEDYVRQVVTYAALLEDRIGLPKRCVLFFVNEPDPEKRLLAIPISRAVIRGAVDWTLEQVQDLRQTVLQMQQDPLSIDGGDLRLHHLPLKDRVTKELQAQCTACGQRFDCAAYRAYLGPGKNGSEHTDVDTLNVAKN